jgi:hypothetical protein
MPREFFICSIEESTHRRDAKDAEFGEKRYLTTKDTKLKNIYFGDPSRTLCPSLKISVENLGQFMQKPFNCVIPAWSAGIQVDMDVSGGILAKLDAGNPCRHDENRPFHVLWASVSSWLTSW